jgi:energy-coupling factor transporter ATP-binding protein EcfA2
VDDALLTEVLTRLDADDADGGVDEDVALLVLAACQGDEELAMALADEPVDRPEPAAAPDEREPAGASLTALTVEGFRGIGPAATLTLQPGPGLTLVVGRNGSGKSSFAEALEVLLTGDNQRWSARARAWQEGWRNLHADGAPSISAAFAEEGVAGTTTVRRTWTADGGLLDADTRVQRHGQPVEGLDALGWTEPLTAFRPFLSYNELSSMLDEGPSKLYDALKAILGLDDLVVAGERLRQARLDREKQRRAAKAELDRLLPQLADLDDARARTCHAALAGPRWDLGAVEATVLETGEAASGEELARLRALASLRPPEADRAATVARGLRTAAEAVEAVQGTDAARARRLAALLDGALALHAAHGDGDCPVCGRAGALDAGWEAEARAQAAALQDEAAEADRAHATLATALRRAEELIDLPPPALGEPAPAGVDLGGVPRSWQHWWDGGQTADPRKLADHIEASLPPLLAEAEQLCAAADAELRRRQDAWRPLALQLSRWLGGALEAEVAGERISKLKAAEQWLQTLTNALRDERFTPIAEGTKRIWETLRTRSNVALSDVVLEGSGTRRRVALEVTVDGVAGAALGVMSQGELHSLALSLFLPRATVPESPFRFLVIDDPVQSMDPSRVDGLARVLAEVARERQVIVLTHDDRLPEAVRRLQIEATVVGVTRRPGSQVEVRTLADPVALLLDDARALAQTGDLPDAVARRVVPGFCRAALEAACIDVVRRRRLGRGDPHVEVEQVLAEARSLTGKMALAIFDDPGRGSDVLSRCNVLAKGGAAVYQHCQKGTHEGYPGSLLDLVRDAEELVRGVLRQ